MRRLRAWLVRLAGTLTGRRGDHFDAELQSNIELHIEHNIGLGMAPDEARRQALIALGGVQATREAYRDRGGLPSLDTLVQDVRFGFRMLRKAPGFTLAAVLILALGIGANASLFSLINATLLRPLNGGSLDRPLVGVYSGDSTRPDRYRFFSYPEYVDIRDRGGVFTHLIAEGSMHTGITEGGQTRRLDLRLVSSNYFAAQNAPMAAGRDFTRTEEDPRADAAVAIVSYDFWRSRDLTRAIIGQPIVLNGRRLTIIGVAPEWFHGTMPVMATDVWVPFGAARLLVPADQRGFIVPASTDRSTPALLLAGVLAQDLSLADAEARLVPLARGLAATYPEFNANQRLLVRERSRTARGTGPRTDTQALTGATVLMALAWMVLFVACLNLANMLLARGGARRQEIAVRLALGGSRARIVRQLVIEGGMLSAAGGAAALLLSWLAARLFVDVMRGQAISMAIDVSPDIRVIGMVLASAVFSTLAFSLGPAWRLSKPQLAAAMKPAAADLGPARRWLPSTLVGAQISLSLALIISAGVFVRATASAATVDPGFPLAGQLIVQVDPALIGYDAPRARQALHTVLERIRHLPGVRDASFASIVPFGNYGEGRFMRGDGTDTPPVFASSIVTGTRYFSTVGLPILAGRDFTAGEEASTGAAVGIIDQMLAEQLFGSGNALGRVVHLIDPEGGVDDSLQVVGVVPAIRDDVAELQKPHLYVPFGRTLKVDMTFHARVDPASELRMLEEIRQTILTADDQLPVEQLRTMTAQRNNSSGLMAMTAMAGLFAAFGAIGVSLSTVGVYGLRAYLVTRRTRDIGIRIALGASRGRIAGQLLWEGAGVAATGIAIGLALAAALVTLLRQSGMLVDVATFDPLVYGAAALTLAVTTTLASYLPARRALRIDPAVALRPE